LIGHSLSLRDYDRKPVQSRFQLLQSSGHPIEATRTHLAIAAQILTQSGDYVLSLKGNQSRLHVAVTKLFAEAKASGFARIAHDTYETLEKGHSHIKRCRYLLLTGPTYLAMVRGSDR
jgi:hypothetical protein